MHVHLLSIVVAVGLTLVVPAAHAAPPDGAQPDATAVPPAVDVEALPRSRAAERVEASPTPPKLRPGERAPGFHLERARHAPAGAVTFALVGDSAAAIERHTKGPLGEAEPPSACFENGFAAPHVPGGVQWTGGLSPVGNVLSDAAAPAPSLLRSRQLVVTGPSRARVETRVAWVDARVLSARTLSSTSVDVAKVRTLPGGVDVWAGRLADAETGRESLLFVVDRGEPKPEHTFIGAAFARHATRSLGASGACPLVVDLAAGRGESDQITVQLEVILSAQPVEGGGAPAFGVLGLRAQRELRIRNLLIGLSVSSLPSEVRPVVGVAHGFLGRERVQVL